MRKNIPSPAGEDSRMTEVGVGSALLSLGPSRNHKLSVTNIRFLCAMDRLVPFPSACKLKNPSVIPEKCPSPPRIPRTHAYMPLFFELTELFYTVPSSGRMGLCFCGACINPALFHAPTGGSILEATVPGNQGRTTSRHENEASLPSEFHHPRVRTETFFDWVQSGPPPNLPTHDWDSETELEVSATSFP